MNLSNRNKTTWVRNIDEAKENQEVKGITLLRKEQKICMVKRGLKNYSDKGKQILSMKLLFKKSYSQRRF